MSSHHQAECFTLPKPEREPNQPPCCHPVTFGGPDQPPSLCRRQGGYLVLRGLGGIDQGRGVDRDQLPFDATFKARRITACMWRTLAPDRPSAALVLYSSTRCAGRSLSRRWRPIAGTNVPLDIQGVPVEGAGADLRLSDLLEVGSEPLPHGHAPRRDELPPALDLQQTADLRGGLCPGAAGHVLSVRLALPVPQEHRAAPAPVRELVDRALTIAPAARAAPSHQAASRSKALTNVIRQLIRDMSAS